MSEHHFFSCVMIAVLAACIAQEGDPEKNNFISKLDVSTVINKTVCPIKVEIDEDPVRVPKFIKTMKCHDDQNMWCSENNVPPKECCQARHGNVQLGCVEIQDVVQVYYPASDMTQEYRISVGCACVIEQAMPLEEPTLDGR